MDFDSEIFGILPRRIYGLSYSFNIVSQLRTIIFQLWKSAIVILRQSIHWKSIAILVFPFVTTGPVWEQLLTVCILLSIFARYLDIDRVFIGRRDGVLLLRLMKIEWWCMKDLSKD